MAKTDTPSIPTASLESPFMAAARALEAACLAADAAGKELFAGEALVDQLRDTLNKARANRAKCQAEFEQIAASVPK